MERRFVLYMRIDIITIFPEIFDFYLNQSLIAKAQKKGVLKIKTHNLRDFALDKHKIARPHRYASSPAKHCGRVDDKPFGGGRGMVLKVEPLFKAISTLSKLKVQSSKLKVAKRKVVLFSPRGKKFTQKMATRWSKLDQLILICGRYEAIDERVAKHLADEVISLGDFVLMGGEIPALAVAEAVSRLLPGVAGHSESLIDERITKDGGFIEYPQYTRPEVYKTKNGKLLKTPKVLLSGNHKKIGGWREKHSKVILS